MASDEPSTEKVVATEPVQSEMLGEDLTSSAFVASATEGIQTDGSGNENT